MLKKIFSLTIMITLFGFASYLFAFQIQFSDTVGIQFPQLDMQDASVHFDLGGNDMWGVMFLRGTGTVNGSDGVIISGETINCTQTLKGLYYNPARGKRLRPLDQESLVKLQNTDSSYNTLTLTGALFMGCSGKNATSIAGQITHILSWQQFKLIAGVTVNSNNTYTLAWADNLQFASGTLSGKLFDNYAGGATVYGTGISFFIPYSIVAISPSYATTASGVSIANMIGASISLPADQAFLFGGTGVISTISDLSTIPVFGGGASGLNLSGGVTIDGVTIVPTEALQINTEGTGITLYQSWNTNSYVTITDNTTILAASGWNDTLQGPIISGNTITFGSNVPLLFTQPIRIFFYGYAADSTHLVQYKSPWETTWHTISTACNTSFNLQATNISLTWSAKDCYQTNGQHTIIWTHHATIFQIFNSSSPSSAGSQGAWSYLLSKDNCLRNASSSKNLSGANAEGKDYSPSYYDRKCGVSSGVTIGVTGTVKNIVRLGSIAWSTYSTEMNQAYLYAYNIGITNAATIQDANMKKTLTRKDMAKMIVPYASVILGIKPNPAIYKRCDKFTDIKKLDADTQGYIILSCQLGLMGLQADGVHAKQIFEPNKTLTRAHFAAALSRVLFDNGPSNANGGQPYYTKHLLKLKSYGIVKDIAYPQMQERIGYVMLMMMRSYKKDVGTVQYHTSAPENGIDALIGK